jgi:hypothetical protein
MCGVFVSRSVSHTWKRCAMSGRLRREGSGGPESCCCWAAGWGVVVVRRELRAVEAWSMGVGVWPSFALLAPGTGHGRVGEAARCNNSQNQRTNLEVGAILEGEEEHVPTQQLL